MAPQEVEMEDMWWVVDVDPSDTWSPDDERYRLSASGLHPTPGYLPYPIGVWRTKEALDMCQHWRYHGSPYFAEAVMVPANPPSDGPDAG